MDRFDWFMSGLMIAIWGLIAPKSLEKHLHEELKKQLQ